MSLGATTVDILRILLGGVVGGIVGGWLGRQGERQKQLREAMIREATAASEGLGSAIVLLQSLQEQPFTDAPLDATHLLEHRNQFREIVEAAEKRADEIGPKVEALRMFFDNEAPDLALTVSVVLQMALREARSLLNSYTSTPESIPQKVAESPSPAENLDKSRVAYGFLVQTAWVDLSKFHREVQDGFHSWSGPFRRRRRRTRAREKIMVRSRKLAQMGEEHRRKQEEHQRIGQELDELKEMLGLSERQPKSPGID